MGLSLCSLDILFRSIMPAVQTGYVVSLGVPRINVPVAETVAMARAANLPVTEEAVQGGYAAMFRSLGFSRVEALDASDYQGADIVHDLNAPLPTGLTDMADLVIDPGTLEHVFDYAQAMRSVIQMLKVGGAVFHTSPLNWLNHGYYCPSPVLFHDVYAANGFRNITVYKRDFADNIPREWCPKWHDTIILQHRRFLMYVVAWKEKEVPFTAPVQRRFTDKAWLSAKN